MSKLAHTTQLFDQLSLVRQRWDSAGQLAASTCSKYERIHEDWLRHRTAWSLEATTATDVHAFAASRTRMGAMPAPATQALRMAALDTTYVTAHLIGLTKNDPIARVTRPTRACQPRAEVSDRDRAQVHRMCRSTGLVRRPSVVAALAECGVGTAEMGTLTLADAADLGPGGRLELMGTARRPARAVELTEFACEVLARRVSGLQARGCVGEDWLLGPASSQEALCVALRNMLKRDPATKHVTATGLNRWAARQVYRRTGDLRAAAALIGIKDLTAVARYVCD